MTITFSGGTGVSTTGAAKGTTSTTVAYNNVAAGRMAILSVGAKPNTGTVATPSGWNLLGSAQGGTGTNAADTGQTITYVFWKILTGSESGSVTVTGTSTGSIQGSMDVYDKTLTNWDTPVFTTANDSSHGTNHSAASAALSFSVDTGDWLHVTHSGDTDDSTTATSAPTIVQSGSTIGTVTGRSQVRNTSGNQGMTYTWSAQVTAASANTAAITAGFTWSVSSCGPDIIVRLREYDPITALVETFSAALDSTKWTAQGSPAPTTSGGVESFDLSGYTALNTVRNYSFPAGSRITLNTITWPVATNAFYAGMRIGPYGASSDFVGIYFGSDGTTRDISLERSGTTAITATLDTTNHKWIGIRTDGTNIYLETSPNGTAWTVGRTITGGEIPNWFTSTGLQVWIEGAQGGTWVFDDFNNAPNTTTVSQTLDLRWRSYSQVTQSLDLRWRSYAALSQTLDLRWRSYSSVTNSLDLRWKSYGGVTNTLDLRWRAASQLAATLDLRWRSYIGVSATTDIRWRSASQVSKSLDLRWRFYAPVTQTTSLQWRVYQQVLIGLDLRWKTAGTVSQTLDLRWRVAAKISQSLDLRWRSYSAVTPATLDLRWRSAGRVTADLDLRWKAAGRVSQVLDLRWRSYVAITPQTLDLRWRSYSTVTQSLDLRWRGYLRINQTLDLRWRSYAGITQSLDLRWKVYNSVVNSLDLRWRTVGRVSSDLDLRWRLLSASTTVSQALDLRWRSAARVSADLDLRWRSYVSTSATNQLLWRVYQKVTPEDRYLIWRSYAQVVQSLDLRWRSYVGITQSLDLRWRSTARVTTDLDLRWRSIARVSQSLDLRWRVAATVSQSLDLRWRSVNQVSATLDLRWRVTGKVSQSVQLLWRSLALTQAAATDAFTVERNSSTGIGEVIVYDDYLASRTNKVFIANL